MKCNTKTVLKRIKSLGDNQYVPLWTKYVNAHKKFRMYHKKCHHVYVTCWNYFESGYRCPYCHHGIKLSESIIKNKINNLGHGNYILLSKYKNASSRLKFYHKICHHCFYMSWNKFQQGERCPYCNHRRPLMFDKIKNIICQQSHYKYKVLHYPYKYIKAKDKFYVKHEKCGHVFRTTWDRWSHGCRCPYCRSSKGEMFTGLYLRKHNIKYDYSLKLRHPFKGIKRFDYDFYIPNYETVKTNMGIDIEYDGVQHMKPVNIFGGFKKFKRQQYIDHMKDIYNRNHNVITIRIRCPHENSHSSFAKPEKQNVIKTLNQKLLPLLK